VIVSEELGPQGMNLQPASLPGSGRAAPLLGEKQWSYLQRRYELTPREVQIADLVCQGLRNSSIAKSLNIQPATVQAHVRNIYRKVRVRSKINMLLKFVDEAR
jgi:DNA-binding NarL/FixJ family response regulator